MDILKKLDYLLKRLDKKACVNTWYDFTMNARVVFSARQDYRVMHEPTTWSQWMAHGIDGVRPDAGDFETHLSLLFPEVRARGFLEMRSVDCQSRVWQFVPAGWWTGLLYDDLALDAVIELMTPHSYNLYSLLQRAETGLSDPTIGALAIKLIDIAIAGLKRLPACYFGGGALKGLEVFAEQFVLRGRVPANDIMDEYRASGRLDVNCFRKVESRWSDLMAKASDPAQSI